MNDRGLKSGKIFLYENTLRDEKRNTSVGIKRGLRNGGKGSSVFCTRWFIPIYEMKDRYIYDYNELRRYLNIIVRYVEIQNHLQNI